MASNGSPATTVVAANVKVILNNKVIGICTSASWDIEFNAKPIYGIDQLTPQEIMPGTYQTSFSLGGLRILQKSLEDSGIISYPGVNSFAPYISIAIIERLSGQTILNIVAAMVSSVKNSVSSKGLMTFDISGTGFVSLSNSNNGMPGYSGLPQQIT